MKNHFDKIIFSPNDIDVNYSPLRKTITEETFILGVFNPGLTRLNNGNLLMIVRVAEALKNPSQNGFLNIITWTENSGYQLVKFIDDSIDRSDPRKYIIKQNTSNIIYALTSFSWLLPVELDAEGRQIVKVHYDKIIEPEKSYQEFGIEDPRITKIGGTYYMTTCSVSSERHSTTLYSSSDGLNYTLLGIIMDHQNKDMVLFPEKIKGKYYALTRPLGEHYFTTIPGSIYVSGPSMNIAESPDLLHWKPCDTPFIRMIKNSKTSMKIGGGAPPILLNNKWLILFHAVEDNQNVGIYRTFFALLNREKPYQIEHIDFESAVLEAEPDISHKLCESKYLDDIVFTTGIVEQKDFFIVVSGELDLCCRITHIPKSKFVSKSP